MTRYGPQFGPDITFLGVPRCDLDEPGTYAGADVVILGAPFDGGTSHRPGARFGPMAIRMTDYLPHNGSRPSLALRTDGLVDLRVLDAGDVEMYSGDIEKALPALESAVEKVTRAGAIPIVLGGDHSIAFPDAKGVANVLGHGRVSMLHFDAHADTGDIEFGRPSSSRWTSAMACSSRSTSTSVTPATRRAPAPPNRAGCRPASCWTRYGGSVSSCLWSASTLSR